jgi:hypothetical protein
MRHHSGVSVRFSHLEDYPVTATGRKRLSFTFESVVSDFPVAGVAELADALDSKSSGRKAVWVRAPPPADSLTLGVERSTLNP